MCASSSSPTPPSPPLSSSSSSPSPPPTSPLRSKSHNVTGPTVGWQRFAAAALASTWAEAVTLPLDVAKVRLQTQLRADATTGALPRLRYRNMVHGVIKVARREGVTSLWKGLSPALLRQCSYTGTTLLLYPHMRRLVGGGSHVAPEDIGFWRRVLAGGMSGGTAILVLNPTDVVKTQVQAAEARTPLWLAARRVWASEGVRGFWRGLSPNLARCFLSNACQVGAYDAVKVALVRRRWFAEGPLVHFAASSVAGVLSALVCTPADVVKTRLMSQAGGQGTAGMVRYRGVLDALVRIPRLEGVASLYAGFWPIATRKVVWTIAFFMAYESVLKVCFDTYS